MPLSTFASSPKHTQKKATYKKFTYPYPEVSFLKYRIKKIMLFFQDISTVIKKDNPEESELESAEV